MWDEENSAETVTILPCTNISQPQPWKTSNVNVNNSTMQRNWDNGMQPGGLQPPPSVGGWAPTQMPWGPMAPPAPANWHMSPHQSQQAQPQWGGAPSQNNASKRVGGGVQPSTSMSRFDGAVKVDQHTPWDTTIGGSVPPMPPMPPPTEWNGPGGGAPTSGNTRWGQPAAVGMPPVVSNGLWPNGALMNGMPPGGAGWSQQPNPSLAAINAAVAMHRGAPPPPPPPQAAAVSASGTKASHYELTGTGHWKANVPPPPSSPASAAAAAAMMGMMPPGGVAPAMMPPGTGGPAGANWCQPGMPGGPGGPPAPEHARLPPFNNQGAPTGPSQWVGAPHPVEMNNDMMWHDPNPKEKKVQRDIGTSIWGDPSIQRGQEIRRWRDVDQVSDYEAPPRGTDWASLPLNMPSVMAPPNVPNMAGPPHLHHHLHLPQQQQQQQQQHSMGGAGGGPMAHSFPPNANVVNALGNRLSSEESVGGGAGGGNGWGEPSALAAGAGVGAVKDNGTALWMSNNSNVAGGGGGGSGPAAAASSGAPVAGIPSSVLTWADTQSADKMENVYFRSSNFAHPPQHSQATQQQQQQQTQASPPAHVAAGGDSQSGVAEPKDPAKDRKYISDLMKHMVQRGLITSSTMQAIKARPSLALDVMRLVKTLHKKEIDLAILQFELTEQSKMNPYKPSLIHQVQNYTLMHEISDKIGEIETIKTEFANISTGNAANNSNNAKGNNNNGGKTINSITVVEKANGGNASVASSFDNGQSRLQQWKKTNASAVSSSVAAASSTVTSSAATVGSAPSTSGSVDSSAAAADAIIADIQAMLNGAPAQAMGAGGGGEGGDWKSGTLDWSMGCFDGKLQVNGPDANSTSDEGGNAASALMDDGPPEFVPGKKWEWRDPNKVAEDPNATPGTCKPNPLLSLQHPLVAGFDASKNRSVQASEAQDPQQWLSDNDRNSVNNSNTNANNYCVVFQIGDIEEQQAMAICDRAGNLRHFLVIGHKLACAHFFNDVNAVVERLKNEFNIPAEHIKIMSSMQYEKMLMLSRANKVPVTGRWGMPVPFPYAAQADPSAAAAAAASSDVFAFWEASERDDDKIKLNDYLNNL